MEREKRAIVYKPSKSQKKREETGFVAPFPLVQELQEEMADEAAAKAAGKRYDRKLARANKAKGGAKAMLSGIFKGFGGIVAGAVVDRATTASEQAALTWTCPFDRQRCLEIWSKTENIEKLPPNELKVKFPFCWPGSPTCWWPLIFSFVRVCVYARTRSGHCCPFP